MQSRPLYSLPINTRFLHNGIKYTVTNQTQGMAEVFANGKFWAWPHYDGINSIKVNTVYFNQEHANSYGQ